jgi:hypothetical protein
MGTTADDQELRHALGSAAAALWEDEGPPPPGRNRRRLLRIGVGVGLAVTVVLLALVVTVMGSGPPPTHSGAPTTATTAGPVTTSGPRAAQKGVASGGGEVTHGAPTSSGTYGISGAPGAVGQAGAGTSAAAGASNGASSKSPEPSVPALPSGIVGQSAKVEMNGSAGLRVPRHGLTAAIATLTNMAVGDGGYVANSSVQTGSPTPVPVPQASTATTVTTPVEPVPPTSGPSADLTLEIPVAAYQGVVNRLGTVGHVTSLNTHAADVTGQYTDLQARITALQASRQQYLTIMTQASSIGDILAVQSQIDQLQSQIEQLQGQLNVLNSETTYGTLAVTIVEAGARPTPPPPLHMGSGAGRAWHGALHGFLAGVDGIVRASGALLFALLCVALAVLVVLGLRRLFRHVRAAHG